MLHTGKFVQDNANISSQLALIRAFQNLNKIEGLKVFRSLLWGRSFLVWKRFHRASFPEKFMLASNYSEESQKKKLRILFATEYLPPFVSGISNRCKNWINGYREEGHKVTVCSVEGSECDIVAPSIANPFYNHQRFK